MAYNGFYTGPYLSPAASMGGAAGALGSLGAYGGYFQPPPQPVYSNSAGGGGGYTYPSPAPSVLEQSLASVTGSYGQNAANTASSYFLMDMLAPDQQTADFNKAFMNYQMLMSQLAALKNNKNHTEPGAAKKIQELEAEAKRLEKILGINQSNSKMAQQKGPGTGTVNPSSDMMNLMLMNSPMYQQPGGAEFLKSLFSGGGEQPEPDPYQMYGIPPDYSPGGAMGYDYNSPINSQPQPSPYQPSPYQPSPYESPSPSGSPLPEGGGGTNDSLAQLLYSEYQSASDAAKAANEDRYQQALGMSQDLANRTMERVGNFGEMERQAIADRFQGIRGQVNQDLIGRGLSNSTIRGSMMTGVDGQEYRANLDLEDRLNRQMIDYDQSTSDRTLGIIERRNDIGPQTGELAALMQAYGAGGAAGTVPGGSYGGSTGSATGGSSGQYAPPASGSSGQGGSSQSQNGGTPTSQNYQGYTGNLLRPPTEQDGGSYTITNNQGVEERTLFNPDGSGGGIVPSPNLDPNQPNGQDPQPYIPPNNAGGGPPVQDTSFTGHNQSGGQPQAYVPPNNAGGGPPVQDLSSTPSNFGAPQQNGTLAAKQQQMDQMLNTQNSRMSQLPPSSVQSNSAVYQPPKITPGYENMQYFGGGGSSQGGNTMSMPGSLGQYGGGGQPSYGLGYTKEPAYYNPGQVQGGFTKGPAPYDPTGGQPSYGMPQTPQITPGYENMQYFGGGAMPGQQGGFMNQQNPMTMNQMQGGYSLPQQNMLMPRV